MNWGSDFLRGKIYEEIRRYTNELEEMRMNWGSIWFNFFGEGKYTNELAHIRMNWGSDFFGAEDIRMNWKTYE